MTVACVKLNIAFQNIVIRDRSGKSVISKIELFVAITLHWKSLTLSQRARCDNSLQLKVFNFCRTILYDNSLQLKVFNFCRTILGGSKKLYPAAVNGRIVFRAVKVLSELQDFWILILVVFFPIIQVLSIFPNKGHGLELCIFPNKGHGLELWQFLFRLLSRILEVSAFSVIFSIICKNKKC